MTGEQVAFYSEQFERCWPWLEKAASVYGRTHTKGDLWSMIASADAQFWPLPSSAIITQIDEHPTGLRDLRIWIAGGSLDEILDYVPVIEDWARSINCTRVVVAGRKGWLRAAQGYREAAVLMAKDL